MAWFTAAYGPCMTAKVRTGRSRSWITTVAVAAAGAALAAGGGVALATGPSPGSSAELVVTGLPGADLTTLRNLPGLSASSGPFPTVTTGIRRGREVVDVAFEGRAATSSATAGPVLIAGKFSPGTVVLDEAVAAAASAAVGDRVTVSAGRGSLALRVGGIARNGLSAGDVTGPVAGRGYVGIARLQHIERRARNMSSTLYLQLAKRDDAGRYAQWIARRYPGHQVAVHSDPRESGSQSTLAAVLWAGAVALLLTGLCLAIGVRTRRQLSHVPAIR